MNPSRTLIGCVIIACTALTGCESKLTVDMSVTAPADPGIAQVLVDLEGVEFRKDSGGTERLEFNDPLPVNLVSLIDGNGLRLFTDEQLADGRYTGVRLVFDASDDSERSVIFSSGSDFDLILAASEFSSVDFTVSKDDSSSDQLNLTLDLRQSLAFDDNTDDYTLTPLLRSVRTEDAGGLSGAATANCQVGSLLQGGALYVFSNASVEPDDYDGTAAEPYLTTSLAFQGAAPPTYVFQFLPEGDYTLAFSCSADRENGVANDDVRFQNVVNVSVDAGAQSNRNIP